MLTSVPPSPPKQYCLSVEFKICLKNMFEKRYPLYKACADIEINNDETVDIAVREIAKEFEK